jgi:hypothetical protein
MCETENWTLSFFLRVWRGKEGFGGREV